MANIDEIWERIVKHEGETFHTKGGHTKPSLPFTYEIHGNVFYPSRTDWQIPRADFEKALELVPFDGPGAVNNIVQGPSYVWSVLHDPRIRAGVVPRRPEPLRDAVTEGAASKADTAGLETRMAKPPRDAVTEGAATKADIAELKSNITGLETRMVKPLRDAVTESVATKADIADIAGLETRMVKFGFRLGFAIVAANTALIVGLLWVFGGD